MNQKNKMSESIREIFRLFFHGKFKELMLSETENTLLQFFRYCFVGGIATIVDWGTLYCVEKIGVHYMIAAVIAFVFGLICNYGLSKFMVFNGSETKLSAKNEFFAYAIIGVIGLLIVALIPIFFNGMFKADVSFGGTSLIIIVGVILETMKQLESQMLVRNYSGFLND